MSVSITITHHKLTFYALINVKIHLFLLIVPSKCHYLPIPSSVQLHGGVQLRSRSRHATTDADVLQLVRLLVRPLQSPAAETRF